MTIIAFFHVDFIKNENGCREVMFPTTEIAWELRRSLTGCGIRRNRYYKIMYNGQFELNCLSIKCGSQNLVLPPPGKVPRHKYHLCVYLNGMCLIKQRHMSLRAAAEMTRAQFRLDKLSHTVLKRFMGRLDVTLASAPVSEEMLGRDATPSTREAIQALVRQASGQHLGARAQHADVTSTGDLAALIIGACGDSWDDIETFRDVREVLSWRFFMEHGKFLS